MYNSILQICSLVSQHIGKAMLNILVHIVTSTSLKPVYIVHHCLYIGWCFFYLSIIYQLKSLHVILVNNMYFLFTFNLMSRLCIGAILLQFLSLHNHCFGIHLCGIYMVFLFSLLCIRGSHLSFRMCLRCEIPLFSQFLKYTYLLLMLIFWLSHSD